LLSGNLQIGTIMVARKLYAGVRLRELRGQLGLTQKAFAARLGISLPYLNQMENNHRPVSAAVVLALVQEFGFDVSNLTTNDAERMVSDMREALADPVFAASPPPLADLHLTATNAPALARRFWCCTAPTAKPTRGWPRWTMPWGATILLCARRRGKTCATSFTIATIISMRSTMRRNITPAQQVSDKT